MPEFRILGSLQAMAEGEPLKLGGQQQRAVLVLLLNAGRVVPTDTIVDQIWGEEPPPTATTSLQNHVSQLRKLLGSELLVTRAPGYLLQVERDAIDAYRFERILEELEGSFDRGAAPAARLGWRALARASPRGFRLRCLRPARDPATRGASVGRARGTDRCRPGARPAQRARGRARLTREGASARERLRG